MKLILSNRLSDTYTDFKVVRSTKELKELVQKNDFTCEVLIINEFSESIFELSLTLTAFSNRFPDAVYLYISERPNQDLGAILVGLNATTTSKMFYLSSENDLNALIEEVVEAQEEAKTDKSSQSTGLAVSNPISIIKTYMQYVKEDNTKAKVPIVCNRALNAVETIAADFKQLHQDKRLLGQNYVKVCNQAQQAIKGVKLQENQVKKQLEALIAQNTQAAARGNRLQNGIVDFPTFPYVGSKQVIVFKEYTPCRYLTSFILGYANYLRFVNRKNVKVVIVHPKGACFTQKYADFTTISQESYKMLSLYEEELIATNMPKKEVLTKLTQSNTDVIIFIDRLYADHAIVSGKTLQIGAVSGYSDIDRYKLKPEQTIFPNIHVPNAFYCIPTVSNYNANIDSRKAVYAQQCKTCYDKINKMAKIL